MGGYGDSACFCFIFCFVVYVFPCQSTGGEPVLFFFCLAVYDGSFEEVILNIFIAGVVFDLDIVSFFSCIDACLFRDAGMELILFQQNLSLKKTSQYSHNHEYTTPYYNQFCIKLSLFNSWIYSF